MIMTEKDNQTLHHLFYTLICFNLVLLEEIDNNPHCIVCERRTDNEDI